MMIVSLLYHKLYFDLVITFINLPNINLVFFLIFHLELSLTCTASGISEVTIDCEGIEDATLQCSFNSGPLYQC